MENILIVDNQETVVAAFISMNVDWIILMVMFTEVETKLWTDGIKKVAKFLIVKNKALK